MSVDLRAGDCLDVLATIEDASVDAVVTDPPYGISFMGKHWDRFDIERRVGARDVSHLGRLTGGVDSEGRKVIARTASAFATPASAAGAYDFSYKGNRAFQVWCEAWASECLRVLKPGGHLVSFGGTRTYHRLVCGVEDAGFEVRDQLAWMFGSGFPKSLDVSKAIDGRAGAEREVVGHYKVPPDSDAGNAGQVIRGTDKAGMFGATAGIDGTQITAPATDEARRWQGWGTALKPGYEPIVLARKPLAGTVAANVLEHGTGGLNVDGCRIEASRRPHISANGGGSHVNCYGDGLHGSRSLGTTDEGRWPANVVLDEDAAAMLDEQTGELTSRLMAAGTPRGPDAARNALGKWSGNATETDTYGDSGGASRFFYVAKVDAAERQAGLAVPSLFAQDAPERNDHPTVKPIALMRWLIRLVTPPGGLVLDPFLGSGSTGCAAALEGFRFLGIERDPDYMRIAQARISHWAAAPVEAA